MSEDILLESRPLLCSSTGGVLLTGQSRFDLICPHTRFCMPEAVRLLPIMSDGIPIRCVTSRMIVVSVVTIILCHATNEMFCCRRRGLSEYIQNAEEGPGNAKETGAQGSGLGDEFI